jgi:ketosteroid isomerase-like protein
MTTEFEDMAGNVGAGGQGDQPPVSDDLIAQAKAVVARHEAEAMAGNLDGVLTNCTPDIVVLASGAPLVEGLDAMREFYGSLLSAGSFESSTHDYSAAETAGDAVVLHGVARSTLIPPEGPPVPMENNFLMVLKRDEAGLMKFWRVAFAPVSTEGAVGEE